MAIAVGMEGVGRRFGDVIAVAPLDLTIRAGEFFTLLGSSGSGKSTLVKIIGGFDQPTTGRITFDGTDVTRLPANRETGPGWRSPAAGPPAPAASHGGLLRTGQTPSSPCRWDPG